MQSDPNAEPYWRDVGTLEAYWKANLDLASVTPELDMYDQNWPIRTHMESLPPAKFVRDRSGSHGMTLNSLVSGGCIISGSVVVQSVLFPRVRINSFCNIDSAVLLPDVWVGRSCRLRRCVIDRACVIPEGMVIGENAEEDARRFYRSEEDRVSNTGNVAEAANQTGAMMQVLHVCSEMFPLLKRADWRMFLVHYRRRKLPEGGYPRVVARFSGYPAWYSRCKGCYPSRDLRGTYHPAVWTLQWHRDLPD